MKRGTKDMAAKKIKYAKVLRAEGDYFSARAKLLRTRAKLKRQEALETKKHKNMIARLRKKASKKRKVLTKTTVMALESPRKAGRKLLHFDKVRHRKLPKAFIPLYMLAAVIFIYCVIIILSSSQVIEYDMFLGVSDYTGFNVDTDAIYLGTVMPGGTSKRNMFIANSNEVLTFVSIHIEGDLSKWAGVSNNNFFIVGNENRTVAIWAAAPVDAEFGNYSAKVRIISKRLI